MRSKLQLVVLDIFFLSDLDLFIGFTSTSLEASTPLQKETTRLVTNRFYRFGLGVFLGMLIGGGILLSFANDISPSTGIATGIPSIILSAMTYGGLVLIAFGYLYKEDGKKTFIGDFALGCGIGLIAVWFINAGIGNQGAIPLSD